MIADEVAAEAGKTLFSEGDLADAMFILVDGEVDMQYTLGNGEQRTVDTLVAGDLMVWSALVEPYRCTATGTTSKPLQADLDQRPRSCASLCEQNQDLGYRMLICVTQLLATRLEGARVQLATM